MREYLIVALVLATTSCELLPLAEKIYEHTESGDDDTIKEISPRTIAEGAEFDVVLEDGCTDASERCEVDRIMVTAVTATGAFDVSKFVDDRVTVFARESGKGVLAVQAEIDGSTASAVINLEAEPILKIALNPICAKGGSRWIAAGEHISFTYQLFGASKTLLGRLQLPLDTTLVPVNFDNPVQATYKAPMEAGMVPVKFGSNGSDLVNLEVFLPDQAQITILAGGSLMGPTFVLDVEERIEDKRPCSESRAPITVHTETPSICTFTPGGMASMSSEVEAGDKFFMNALTQGTCTVTAVRSSGGTPAPFSFDVSP